MRRFLVLLVVAAVLTLIAVFDYGWSHPTQTSDPYPGGGYCVAAGC